MILLCVLGTLLVSLAILAVWQRETLYFVFNPDRIQAKSADEIREALLSGDYGAVEDSGGVLTYRVLDGTVQVGVTLDQTLQRLDARFNAYNIPISGISDALSKANVVLSPYLSPPEVKALGILISMELPGYVASSGIDYSLDIGSHAVFVAGSMDTGDMLVTVTLLGESP
ncbi:MAG: hypothetical protein LBI19_02690 [Oscillospiraceae bacterium]|nr:hypothetical protein [Oscillospiraceae bacterium]